MKTKSAVTAVLALALSSAACGPAPEQAGIDREITLPGFEAFEARTPRDEETGHYILEGDMPVRSPAELHEFFARSNLASRAVSSAGLVLDSTNFGAANVWPESQRRGLTYCVSTSFGTHYERVVAAMRSAATDWEHAAAVKFVHEQGQDTLCDAKNPWVVFDVRPTTSNKFNARAFLPNFSRTDRNILIAGGGLNTTAPKTLTGVLRHELGHALGFLHEHARPESGACPEFLGNKTDVTPYDRSSVMHYRQCNGTGGDYHLSHTDSLGAGRVYGTEGAFLQGKYQAMNAGPGAVGYWSLDVDGDQRTDLVQGFTGAGGALNLITYMGRDGGFSAGTYQVMNAGSSAVGYWPMDVNGDGREDLVQAFAGANGTLNLINYLSQGTSFAPGVYQVMNAGSGAVGYWPMDVDGDGRKDLVQAFAGANGTLNLIAYLSQGSGFAPGIYQPMNAGSGAIGYWPMDVNGDRRMDLVQGFAGAGGGLNLITYFSEGSRFALGRYQAMNAGSGAIGYWPMDVNGDRRTDLVQGFAGAGDVLNLITYLGQVDGFAAGTYKATNAGTGAVGYWSMDVDGDGDSDLVQGFGDDSGFYTITYRGSPFGLDEVGGYQAMNSGTGALFFRPMKVTASGRTSLVQGFSDGTQLNLITFPTK